MTIPLILFLAAFAIILLVGQMGMKMGAYLALCGTLTIGVSTLVALRYWFLASRLATGQESSPVPMHFAFIFWAIFVVAAVILSRVRQGAIEIYEATHPSLFDRLLGGFFGLISGLFLASALMMTLSVSAPDLWAGYQPSQLPLPIDRWPLQTYRLIETRIAGITPTEPGHTLLPVLTDKKSQSPVDFWR